MMVNISALICVICGFSAVGWADRASSIEHPVSSIELVGGVSRQGNEELTLPYTG
jgi:hypothetical protein